MMMGGGGLPAYGCRRLTSAGFWLAGGSSRWITVCCTGTRWASRSLTPPPPPISHIFTPPQPPGRVVNLHRCTIFCFHDNALLIICTWVSFGWTCAFVGGGDFTPAFSQSRGTHNTEEGPLRSWFFFRLYSAMRKTAPLHFPPHSFSHARSACLLPVLLCHILFHCLHTHTPAHTHVEKAKWSPTPLGCHIAADASLSLLHRTRREQLTTTTVAWRPSVGSPAVTMHCRHGDRWTCLLEAITPSWDLATWNTYTHTRGNCGQTT